MSVDKHEELKFAALHADDLLLDALGARRPAGSPDDLVAGLLQAYVAELDSRPGPLTGLLAADSFDAREYADRFDAACFDADSFDAGPFGAGSLDAGPFGADSLAADSLDAAGSAPALLPVAMVPPPPVELPTHRRANRARVLVAHRAAAVVTVGSLVLGVGGVSAAVTGNGGPLDGIRQVVGSVTEQVTPQRSDADRISGLLSDADKALAAKDLRSARELLEKARTDIEGAADPRSFSSLRTNLIELRDRWHRAWDENQDSPQATESSTDRIEAVPEDSVLTPHNGKPGLVEDGEVSPRLPVGPDSGLKKAKDEVADRAEQKLEPLPNLPIDEIRAPTWAPIVGEGGFPGDK